MGRAGEQQAGQGTENQPASCRNDESRDRNKDARNVIEKEKEKNKQRTVRVFRVQGTNPEIPLKKKKKMLQDGQSN